VALFGKVATQIGVSVGNLILVCPTVIVWRRVETALASSFRFSFLIRALSSLNSLELSSDVVTKRAFASMSVATTPQSAAVTVAKLSKDPMVV
jgi:hypothetical protein